MADPLLKPHSTSQLLYAGNLVISGISRTIY